MRYDLVFEGGGAKGMAFVGAMEAFEAAGHSFGRVVGSSAGAITATVLAAGYDAAEMRAALSEKAGDRPVFATFLGDPPAPADPATSATAEFLHEVDLSFVPQWAEGRLEKKLLDALADSAAGRDLLSSLRRPAPARPSRSAWRWGAPTASCTRCGRCWPKPTSSWPSTAIRPFPT